MIRRAILEVLLPRLAPARIAGGAERVLLERWLATQGLRGPMEFVEWWATFDCAEDERDHWVEHPERRGLARCAAGR
jgi:hypothetical protein